MGKDGVSCFREEFSEGKVFIVWGSCGVRGVMVRRVLLR